MHFSDLILRKCSVPPVFLFEVQIEASALYSLLVRFCRQLSQIEARNPGNTDHTLATRGHQPAKIHAPELLLSSSVPTCELLLAGMMTRLAVDTRP